MQSPRAFVAVVVLLLSCAFLGCLPDLDFGTDPDYRAPSPAAVRLDVPYIDAPRADWSWAAAASAVLVYAQTPAEPCTVASRWSGRDCCAAPIDDCVTTPPTAVPLAGLLIDEGLPSLAVGGALTFDEVRREIDAGNPVLVGYAGPIEGHIVVILGYDPGVPDDLAVFVHDPLRGTTFTPFGERLGRAPAGSSWAETVLVRTTATGRMGWDPLGDEEIDWETPTAMQGR